MLGIAHTTSRHWLSGTAGSAVEIPFFCDQRFLLATSISFEETHQAESAEASLVKPFQTWRYDLHLHTVDATVEV